MFIFIRSLSDMNGRVLVVGSHLEYYMITWLHSISLYMYIKREGNTKNEREQEVAIYIYICLYIKQKQERRCNAFIF